MRLLSAPALLLGLLACLQTAAAQNPGDCVADDAPDEGLGIVLCLTRPATVEVNQNTTLSISTQYSYFDNLTNATTLTLDITYQHESVVDGPDTVSITSNQTSVITLTGLDAGRTVISFSCPNYTTNITCPLSKKYLDLVEREVAIVHSLPLNIFIAIVGWLYFVAWSISFYPQIFLNFKRRSVVGLNFDFLAFNLTGFLCYSAFNVGLFWLTAVQREYFERHPAGVNPVQLNDVIFALHAVAATLFTIFQCIIFERGGQRMSYSSIVLVICMWLVMLITLFVSVGNKLPWLDYLYVLSYVKLAVTLVKYVPQAWFNCRRRSTEGWSIGNILLDFTGGTLSIFQMFLLSYNYNDWNSIFGDPTKFGLGFFSIVFDILFIMQHYVLFPARKRKKGYKKIDSADEIGSTDEESPLLKEQLFSSTNSSDSKGKLFSCCVK